MKIDTDDITSRIALADAIRALRDVALRLDHSRPSDTSKLLEKVSYVAEFEQSEEYRIMRDSLDKGDWLS